MEEKAKTLSHQGKIQSSFLDLDDVPEIIQDMNKEIMTENDKATQTDVSKYVLACQIANRVEPVLLRNQMNVSSEHVRTVSNLSFVFTLVRRIFVDNITSVGWQ